MPDDKKPDTGNPPHNRIDHEKWERERIRLYWYHKRAGSIDVYYLLYPQERPPSRDAETGRGGGGRGGR